MATTTLNGPLARGNALCEVLRQAAGVGWVLVLVWVFYVAARDHRPVFTSRDECGTDPRDFLRAGELLEKESLRFIVDSHCANARFQADGWIELRFNKGPVDVQTHPLRIGGTTYYKVVWVGGTTEP